MLEWKEDAVGDRFPVLFTNTGRSKVGVGAGIARPCGEMLRMRIGLRRIRHMVLPDDQWSPLHFLIY